MLNLEEAQKLVIEQVISTRDDCALMTEATQEYAFGWVFFYQSRKYIESHDFMDMIVGHGPVIVDRQTGQLFETGSAYPAEHYVKAYMACGDPLAEPASHIEINGWQKEADKTAVIIYIKRVANISLQEAKELVDQVLEGKVISFQVSSPEKAAEAVKIIASYGFTSKQLWSNQC